MKLFLYARLMKACDFLCADLHRTERHVQAVRVWAWQRATRLNLATCNTRAVRTHL